MAKLLGEVARGAVTRDFIMCDALCGSDQREVGGGVFLFLTLCDDLLAWPSVSAQAISMP